MKSIFVDFEMNPIEGKYQEEREICRREIIEIGAVALDEENQECVSFKSYVKPQFNEAVVKSCSQITGITIDTLADAPVFTDIYGRFADWCTASGGKNGYEIYAWSENDEEQLIQEIRLKKIDQHEQKTKWMLSHWKDFQREFSDLLGIHQVIALDRAMNAAGKRFEGKMHDALWDARNTAFLFALSRDRENFRKTMEPILQLLAPRKPMTYSLGDAVNLSSIRNRLRTR